MRAFALGCLLLLAACDLPGETGPPRPERGVPAPPELPSPVGEAPSRSRPRPSRLEPPPSPAAPDSTEEPSGEPPAPDDPVPDPLPDTLRRAFGTPTECISEPSRERLEGTLTIHLRVVVTGSGRVTRASVRAPELAVRDVECLRRRAEALRLPGDIPDAPRAIAATLVYDIDRGGERVPSR